MGGPALNAILSRDVPGDEQGELQGAVASTNSLTSVGAMLLMPNLFGWFTGPAAPVYFPGAAFTAASLCELAGLAVFVLAVRKLKPVS